MYTVYWTQYSLDDEANPMPQLKTIEKLTDALKECETLRKRRRAGEHITFITMVSENPDSVGQAGVDVTGPEYDWKKRRV